MKSKPLLISFSFCWCITISSVSVAKLPFVLAQGSNKEGAPFFDLLLPAKTIKTITIIPPTPIAKSTLATYKTAGVLPYFSTGSGDKKNIFVVLYSPIQEGSYSDCGGKKASSESMPYETATRLFFAKTQKTWKTFAELADLLTNLTPWGLGNNHYMYLVRVPTRAQLLFDDNTIVVPLMNLIASIKKVQDTGKCTKLEIVDEEGFRYPFLEKFICGLASSPAYLNALRMIIFAENAADSTALLEEIMRGE